MSDEERDPVGEAVAAAMKGAPPGSSYSIGFALGAELEVTVHPPLELDESEYGVTMRAILARLDATRGERPAAPEIDPAGGRAALLKAIAEEPTSKVAVYWDEGGGQEGVKRCAKS